MQTHRIEDGTLTGRTMNIMTTNHNLRDFYDPRHGIYVLYLHGATCSLLSHLLSPKMPYIFFDRHGPIYSAEWSNHPVVFSKKGTQYAAEIKAMSFDFRMLTNEFLEILDEFEKCGILLYQSNKEFPHNFQVDTIEGCGAKLMRENGIISGFYLPHEEETAQFMSFDEEHFSRILKNPVIVDKMFC